MDQIAPIAFIDSGIGGLPYLSHLRQILPGAPLVYVADNLNFPYGKKNEEEVQACVLTMTQRLVARYHPQLIVVACNTASMIALDLLRETFPIDFVGVVPAVKPASSLSKTRKIGIMATERALKGSYIDQLIGQYAPDCLVEKFAATELINTIEIDPFVMDKEHYRKLLEEIRRNFQVKGIDTVVLGCTHFLHLDSEMSSVFGHDFQIVDSRYGVSAQVCRILKKKNSLSDSALLSMAGERQPMGIFHLTGDETSSISVKEEAPTMYQRIAEKFELSFGGVL